MNSLTKHGGGTPPKITGHYLAELRASKRISDVGTDAVGKRIELIARALDVEPTPENLRFMIHLLLSKFGHLSLEELHIAVEMAISGDLDVFIPAKTFNAQVLGSILREYHKWSSGQLVGTWKEEVKKEPEQDMAERITAHYHEYKLNGVIMSGYTEYIYLKERGLLELSKEEKEANIEAAKELVKRQKEGGGIRAYVIGLNEGAAIRNEAGGLCVKMWFDKIKDIKDAIS